MDRYTTRLEAIEDIVDAIEAGGAVEDPRAEFDIDAIADEVLTYDPALGHIQDAAFVLTVDADEFWDVVAKHAR